MYALVTDGTITKYFSYPKGFKTINIVTKTISQAKLNEDGTFALTDIIKTIDDVTGDEIISGGEQIYEDVSIQVDDGLQYPKDIFMKWSVEEKKAIGIYEVVYDNSNFKDEKWYINTNQSFAFADGTVTASYGTATAKAHADTTWSQDDEDAGDLPDDKSVGDIKTRGLKYNLIQILKSQVAGILNDTDWYITRNTEKSTAIPSAISTHRNAVRTKQASMETAITNASNTPALETLYTYTTTDDVQSRPLGELPTLEI